MYKLKALGAVPVEEMYLCLKSQHISGLMPRTTLNDFGPG